MEKLFRAWDIKNKVMINPAVELIEVQELTKSWLNQSSFSYFDGLKWMQFIGIHDKLKGKMFEEDMVSVPDEDNLGCFKTVIIKYLNGTPCYYDPSTKKYEYICLWIGDTDIDEDAKIIGNTFEN